MGSLTDIYGFIIEQQFSVPLWEVVAYVIIITFCLLFGRHSLGLIISYCFVFYWGFIFNLYVFIDILNETRWGLSAYALFGLFMLIVSITGFFINNKD